MKIEIVAPSSVVPQVELKLGVARLRREGFEPRVHAQTRRKHLFFAGTDEERAEAFFAAAHAADSEAIWSARGGYGAFRLLERLEMLTAERGKPRKKLFVGYSDSTALMEFARVRWGWATLHGPMPSFREFSLFTDRQFAPIAALVKGETPSLPFDGRKLVSYGVPAQAPARGELVGGNLTVWASMVGTRYAGDAAGKLLFLEDVTESPYRVDRVVGQLRASGGFEGVKAILLGTWHLCDDSAPSVLKNAPVAGKKGLRMLQAPKPSELKPLRPLLSREKALRAIFGELSRELGIPVFAGLRSGHGPEGHEPLPLGGAQYELSADGRLKLESWTWRRAPG